VFQKNSIKNLDVKLKIGKLGGSMEKAEPLECPRV
jgi:hypothetical protein